MWGPGPPFGLTSLKLLAVVIAVGLACLVYLLWRLNRSERPRRRARVLDAVLYTGATVLPVLALFMLGNRLGGFYTSFAELADQIGQLAG